MSEVLQANVFFFVTGIAVIIISAILCVLLYHLIRALKSVRRILMSIEQGTEAISHDMQNLRSYFVRGGLIGGIASILRGVRGDKDEDDTEEETSKKKKRKKSELRITDVSR